MAGYNVDINIALKNSNKLIKLRKELKAATDNIREFNKEASKQNKVAVSTFGKLNKQISRARSLLDKAAIGTSSFTRAARAAVAVEKEMNLQLRQKERLLAKIRAESVTSGQQAVIERTVRARQVNSGFAGFSARANQVAESAKIEAIKNKARDKHLRNIDKKVGKIATIQTQGQASAAFSFLPGGDFGMAGGQIGPRLPLVNRLGFGKNAQSGPFAMQGGAMGRLKGGVGSALIGGGFPALFGAGGISSAFGAVAGGLGGALAPGGGFAASIFATAIAAQIEKAREFNKAVEDLNRSIAATGGQSRFTAGQINEFAESMRMTKEEALEALKAFEQFGAAARISLIKVFGDEATFNMLASFKDSASILDQMDEITKSLGFEQAGLILQILDTQGARAAENKILELTVKKNKELNMQIKERVGAEGRLRKIRKEQRAEDELRVQQEINNARTILELQTRRLEQQERLAIMKAPIDEMEKLSDVLFQVDALGKSIGDSFSESFKGIVSGSMTAQQALRNLFQRTADHFLDMAAQMLAAQIRSGIFGIFKSFMGLGPLGNPLSRATNTSVAATGIPSGLDLLPGSFGISSIDRSMPNVRGSGMFGRRASGGPVMGGGSYLVGERGPELFSPGVSGTITPNHALGGTTNVVVNVDASGSSVQGDEQQSRELGRLISVAVQSEILQQKRPGGLLA